MENEIKTFKDFPLDNQIKRAISELGFKNPTEVQKETIPKILESKDLTVKAQTGSGKTAAFAIPICEKIDIENDSVQAVILVPTRELAGQVKEDIEDIGMYRNIKTCVLYGKQSMEVQRRELREKPHVVVATPGRLLDHIKKKNIKLKEVNRLVIDEADEMLLMGFKEQIEFIISKMPEERNTLLFSATISDQVNELSQKYTSGSERIEVESEVSTRETIEELYYAVDGLKKVDFMKKAIRHEKPKKCIIFCNTREQVDNLFDIFRKWDKGTCAVHGGMDQGMRTQKLREFKRGKYTILIATDVAARGIHIQGVTHVINYGVPFEHEQYVHRIGRTGRAGEEGVAITMVIPSEMDRFNELQEFLGYEIPCRGGHINKKPKRSKATKKGREKFKQTNQRGSTVKIKAGINNSQLKKKDIIYALEKIPGIDKGDIGKVEIGDKTTNITIYNDKRNLAYKGLKSRGIRKKKYKIN